MDEIYTQFASLAARKNEAVAVLEASGIVRDLFAFAAGIIGALVANNWLFGRDISAMKTQLGFVVDIAQRLDDRADRLDSRITRIEGRFDGFPKHPR